MIGTPFRAVDTAEILPGRKPQLYLSIFLDCLHRMDFLKKSRKRKTKSGAMQGIIM